VKQRLGGLLEGLSSEQVARLHRFEALLLQRAVPLGFVSTSDSDRLFERHVLDSMRVLRCLRSRDRSLVDVGSGAGLPGVPVAIARPDLRVVLLEARSRRAAFLEMAVVEIGLSNASVEVGSVEATRARADVCTARAFSDAEKAWGLVRRILNPNGRLLYFAGRTWGVEAIADLKSARVSICEASDFPGYGPIVIIREPPPDR
jgi:16S rRNA (guanine527-N7)-methyltransferase